jgi:hypothetical protein
VANIPATISLMRRRPSVPGKIFHERAEIDEADTTTPTNSI